MTLGSNSSGHLFDTTFNTDGVLYSDSNGVITSTSVGSATQVLTSNGTGNAPTFQAVTGGISGPGSSTSNGVATWNGIGGTALLSPPTPLVSSSGVVTNSNQPCFLAYLSTTTTNATGDGTVYQVAFDTVVFDQGSNFTIGASANFTAPLTGKYFFTTTVTYSGASPASGFVFITDLVATSKTMQTRTDLSGGTALGGLNTYTNSSIIDMTAGDTLFVNAESVGGTKTTSIVGGTTPYTTFISGYLMC
jgi:hypothetical protein